MKKIYSYLFLHRDQSQTATLMQPFNCIYVHLRMFNLMCIDRGKGTDHYEAQNKNPVEGSSPHMQNILYTFETL